MIHHKASTRHQAVRWWNEHEITQLKPSGIASFHIRKVTEVYGGGRSDSHALAGADDVEVQVCDCECAVSIQSPATPRAMFTLSATIAERDQAELPPWPCRCWKGAGTSLALSRSPDT